MNKKELYCRLLTKFNDNQKNFVPDFKNYIDNQDMESATIAAHTLKGLAANLGMTELQQASITLEMACRENADNIEYYFIRPK